MGGFENYARRGPRDPIPDSADPNLRLLRRRREEVKWKRPLRSVPLQHSPRELFSFQQSHVAGIQWLNRGGSAGGPAGEGEVTRGKKYKKFNHAGNRREEAQNKFHFIYCSKCFTNTRLFGVPTKFIRQYQDFTKFASLTPPLAR